MVGAGGCSWPQDNPHDPFRCVPLCTPSQRCLAGQCVPRGDASTDAPSLDLLAREAGKEAGQDAALDSGIAAARWSWALPIQGRADVIVAGLDLSGTFTWAIGAGGSHDDACRDLALNSGTGDVLVTGFHNSLSVAFGSATLTNSTTSNAHGFLARVAVP